MLPSIRSSPPTKFNYRREIIRATVPRQGACGVLARRRDKAPVAREDSAGNSYNKILPLPPLTPRIVFADSLKAARTYPAVEVTPRYVTEEAIEEMLGNLSGGVTVRTLTPPSQTMRETRRRKKVEDITEAQQALRKAGRKPGDWDAKLYCRLRQSFLQEGRLDAIAGLTSMAAQASHAALEAGEYRLASSPSRIVSIPKRDHVEWFGLQNLPPAVDPIPTNDIPPIVCSSMRVLDAAGKMLQLFPEKLVCASFDATDFSHDGKSMHGSTKARSFAQQEIFIRTNLEYCTQRATVFCRHTTMQDQLTAKQDPYIIAANEVVLFRGPAEEGYPFLESQATISLLVTGRAAARPSMSDKGEYFEEQDDMLACIDRLNLIALGAAHRGYQEDQWHAAVEDNGVKGLIEQRKPVLIISLQDLTAQQPRESIATALKGWRLQHAHMFHAVILACGDNSTAVIMDKTVNGPLYATALAGQISAADWHWNEQFLELSVTGACQKIGEKARTIQDAKTRQSLVSMAAHTQAPKSPDSLATQSDGRRRSNLTLAMDAVSVVDEQNERVRVNSKPKLHVWSPAASVTAQENGQPSLAEKEKSSPVAFSDKTDSRSTYAVALSNRLIDTHSHEHVPSHLHKFEYQDPQTEIEAEAGKCRAKAVSAIISVGKQSTKIREKREQHEAKRMQKQCKALAISDELQSELHIEEHTHGNRNHVEDNRERLLMESLQNLASSVDRTLQTRQQTHVPSLS